MPQQPAHHAGVAGRELVEAAVEQAKQAAFRAVGRLQQQHTERGAERQGHKARDGDRHRDRDRKLLVHLTRDAAEEGDRHEHRT